MVTEQELDRSKVSVTYTKSSSKDAGEGWAIRVDEGADQKEADRVMVLALRLRQQAVDALKGPSLEAQLKESIQTHPNSRVP